MLLLSPGGASAQAPPLAEGYAEAGPFPNEDAFVGWLFGEGRRPLAAGVANNPDTDPDIERPYFYVIEQDTTAWVQSPRGEMLLADPFVLWKIGQEAGHRAGYAEQRRDAVGYGWEDGELYVSLSQSTPIRLAVFVFGLIALGGAAGVWSLVGRLREATERGRQLADSRRRLADSRESERLRLARDLHDGPLQDLQAVRMRLGMAERTDRQAERATGGALTETVADVQEEVLRVISELREISEGLRPPVLASFGLGAAVRALAERARTSYPDVRIGLHFDDEGSQLSDGVRLVLYRVAQEALNNALRHGRPSRVSVRYSAGSGALRLSVEDDGRGMEVPANLHDLEIEGHLGLAGMAERAESVGGTLRVTSEPGCTRIEARVPILAHVSAD